MPLPPFSPVSAHTVVDLSLFSPAPIMLVRLLLLSFEGDHLLDLPPSEDELKAICMMKILWKALQTVSVASLKYLSFHSTIKLQDAQQFWNPLCPKNMAHTLHKWNMNVFFWHGAQIALCEAFTDAESSRFALYWFSSAKALPPAEEDNYFLLPDGLWWLNIFDFLLPPINTTADVRAITGKKLKC